MATLSDAKFKQNYASHSAEQSQAVAERRMRSARQYRATIRPEDHAAARQGKRHRCDAQAGHALAQHQHREQCDIVHAGGVMVPTALAVAEKRSRSGKQTLTAIVAGYEIATRIGMVASKGFHSQGLHPTGVCGAFGAAATAAKLLGLDAGQFAHALGIAGSQASGSLEFLADGAWTKRRLPAATFDASPAIAPACRPSPGCV